MFKSRPAILVGVVVALSAFTVSVALPAFAAGSDTNNNTDTTATAPATDPSVTTKDAPAPDQQASTETPSSSPVVTTTPADPPSNSDKTAPVTTGSDATAPVTTTSDTSTPAVQPAPKTMSLMSTKTTTTSVACSGSGSLTWTKDAHLSTATVTLKTGFATCDVSLSSYDVQGATWATSGNQTFVDHQTVHLTTASPTATLKVKVQGCFQQQDLFIGTKAYDGKDGALPHYPTSSTPDGLIDHWNGAADCAPPTAAVCTTKGAFLVTNLNEQGFNYLPTGSPYADTRAKGHYEYVSGALRMYTDDNSGLAKVQAARAVNIPVANYGGAFSLNQTLTTGTIKVGINVRFTDGGQSFTATAEPGVPGYKQLWSNAAGWLPLSDSANPGNNNGQGGPYAGTIDDIVASHPNATVTVEALSDGSGVYNDALIASWSTPCNTYTYDHATAPVVAPAVTIQHGVAYCNTDKKASFETVSIALNNTGSNVPVTFTGLAPNASINQTVPAGETVTVNPPDVGTSGASYEIVANGQHFVLSVAAFKEVGACVPTPTPTPTPTTVTTSNGGANTGANGAAKAITVQGINWTASGFGLVGSLVLLASILFLVFRVKRTNQGS